MLIYKIIVRDTKTKRQHLKKVYLNKEKYDIYAPAIIIRYLNHYKESYEVERYTSEDGKDWKYIDTIGRPKED